MANITFKQNLLPKTDNTYTLGNSNYKWNIYANTINGTAVSELGLPAVDSTNNGQILQVDNGGWTVGAAKLNASEKGVANGVASLDSTGKVPTSQLPAIGSGLPNVTSADNGKVLLVNAGTWTASTLSLPTKVSDLTNDSGFLTSVPAMTGATSSTAGAAGLVPAPATTDISYFLRGDGTWASADTWGGTTYSPYSYIQDSEYYIPARASMNGTSMSSIWVSSTPNIHALAKYDANKYLYSTTPGTSDNSTKVATTAFVNNVLPSTMTGATSSTAGTAGLIPAPASADREKFFRGDGTWQNGGKPMVILSYGNSTWNDFITAYNNNVIVYCRASSNSNPATGSQTRMAFMAYVNNATNPTNVEFQYYRSVNPNQKSASQMSDQVFVYTLTNANGGTWSVTTRQAGIQSIAAASGSKIGVSYSNNVVTLSNTMTAADMPMSSSDATTTNSAISTLSEQIATQTAGLRMIQISQNIVIPDGQQQISITNIDISSYIPSGYDIYDIAQVRLGNYMLPYFSDNKKTWVDTLDRTNKTIIFKNTASEWNNYWMNVVLFVKKI